MSWRRKGNSSREDHWWTESLHGALGPVRTYFDVARV